MGARPSSFRKTGGGFLNGVDGRITDYHFTDEFNGNPFVPGKKADGKPKFHWLYAVLSVRVDGAEEDVTTTLTFSGYDDWEVSEDGKTVVPTADGRTLGEGPAWPKFITSMCQNGFDENELPENDYNWEAIIGRRCHFIQQTNEKMKAEGKKRIAKNGKEYFFQDLVVDQVYPADDVKVTVGTGKAAPKGKAAKATNDLAERSEATLFTILGGAPNNAITLSKLGVAIVRATTAEKAPDGAQQKTFLTNPANLAGIEGIAFDAATNTVSLA